LLAEKREGGWLGFKRRGPIFEFSSTLFAKKQGFTEEGQREFSKKGNEKTYERLKNATVWAERWVKVENRGKAGRVEEVGN
jgi:hypothetical protein